jgi:hypothetical protein
LPQAGVQPVRVASLRLLCNLLARLALSAGLFTLPISNARRRRLHARSGVRGKYKTRAKPSAGERANADPGSDDSKKRQVSRCIARGAEALEARLSHAS